ncbi:hypothetical protein D3C84_1179220 [compost metagenome]
MDQSDLPIQFENGVDILLSRLAYVQWMLPAMSHFRSPPQQVDEGSIITAAKVKKKSI